MFNSPNVFNGQEGRWFLLSFTETLTNPKEVAQLQYIETELSPMFNGGFRFVFKNLVGEEYYIFPDDIDGCMPTLAPAPIKRKNEYELRLTCNIIKPEHKSIGEFQFQQSQGFLFNAGCNLMVADALSKICKEASTIDIKLGRVHLVEYLRNKGLLEPSKLPVDIRCRLHTEIEEALE